MLLQKNVDVNSNVVIYSYWMSNHALVGIMLKKLFFKNAYAVSRAHGYDLYHFRHKYNYRPLQAYMIEHLDAIYPASKDGEQYLSDRYPSFAYKISNRYLGVSEVGHNPEGKGFHIVSCSNIIPLKRVDLIGQAVYILMQRYPDIRWTHFGSGSEFKKLHLWKNSLECSDRINIVGFVANSDIIKFYQQHPCHLFINASTTEGTPVSIMESYSFGIPAVATNVGGNSEIVMDGHTGLLVAPDVDAHKLSDTIEIIYNMSNEEIAIIRANSKARWSEFFNAKKNYTSFANELFNGKLMSKNRIES